MEKEEFILVFNKHIHFHLLSCITAIRITAGNYVLVTEDMVREYILERDSDLVNGNVNLTYVDGLPRSECFLLDAILLYYNKKDMQRDDAVFGIRVLYEGVVKYLRDLLGREPKLYDHNISEDCNLIYDALSDVKCERPSLDKASNMLNSLSEFMGSDKQFIFCLIAYILIILNVETEYLYSHYSFIQFLSDCGKDVSGYTKINYLDNIPLAGYKSEVIDLFERKNSTLYLRFYIDWKYRLHEYTASKSGIEAVISLIEKDYPKAIPATLFLYVSILIHYYRCQVEILFVEITPDFLSDNKLLDYFKYTSAYECNYVKSLRKMLHTTCLLVGPNNLAIEVPDCIEELLNTSGTCCDITVNIPEDICNYLNKYSARGLTRYLDRGLPVFIHELQLYDKTISDIGHDAEEIFQFVYLCRYQFGIRVRLFPSKNFRGINVLNSKGEFRGRFINPFELKGMTDDEKLIYIDDAIKLNDELLAQVKGIKVSKAKGLVKAFTNIRNYITATIPIIMGMLLEDNLGKFIIFVSGSIIFIHLMNKINTKSLFLMANIFNHRRK